MVPKPKGDGKVEQKSLNKIMLTAIVKTHQTMRDLSSTVWDALLIKASNSEADNMQKQTQTYAEKVRQEGRGHTRGPPFVWAHLGLVKSLQEREPLSPMQICNEVRFCRLDKTYKADIKRITLNIVSPEKRLLVLEGLSQTEAERKYPRTRATDLSGGSSEDVKFTVKAFLAEKGMQANSKGWHNAMQSEHVQRMATAYFLEGSWGRTVSRDRATGETCQTTCGWCPVCGAPVEVRKT